MGLRSHLHRRGSHYYFRQRVPKDLVARLGCKEISKSLETSCPRMAMRRVIVASAIHADYFDRMRAMTDDENGSEERDVLKQAITMMLYQNRVAHIERAKAVGHQEEIKADFDAYQRTHKLVTEQQKDAAVRQAAEGVTQNHTEVVVQVLADAGIIPPSTPLSSVPTASEFFPTYLGEKSGRWKDNAKRHNVNYVSLFIKICGDKKVTEYQRKDIVTYVQTLELVHRDYGKAPNDKAVSISDIVRVSEQKRKMNITTLNKHFTAVKGFFRVANLNLDRDINLTKLLDDINFSDDVPQAQERLPWTITELNQLFLTPIWKGSRSNKPSQRHEPGRRIIQDAYWWLPVVAIFTGMRLEEIAQLQARDFSVTSSGIPFVRVTEGEGKRVKTQSSIRDVPIHPTLVSLGFPELIRDKNPCDRIFQGLLPRGKEQKCGHDFSQDFTDYRRQIGLYRELVDFHSFRHTFATHLYLAISDMFMVGEIIGHKTDKSETPTYVHPSVEQKYQAILKLGYEGAGLNIVHLFPKKRPATSTTSLGGATASPPLGAAPVPADHDGDGQNGKPDAPKPPMAGHTQNESDEEKRIEPGMGGEKRHSVAHPSQP